jgi:hypothetical protein
MKKKLHKIYGRDPSSLRPNLLLFLSFVFMLCLLLYVVNSGEVIRTVKRKSQKLGYLKQRDFKKDKKPGIKGQETRTRTGRTEKTDKDKNRKTERRFRQRDRSSSKTN